MKAPGEQARFVQRPEIGDILDHAERPRVPSRIGADAAGIDRVDIAAHRAMHHAGLDGFERAQEGHQRRIAPLEQMQHSTPRRARTKAGQSGKRLGQRVNLG